MIMNMIVIRIDSMSSDLGGIKGKTFCNCLMRMIFDRNTITCLDAPQRDT